MPDVHEADIAGVRVSTDHYIGGQRASSRERFDDISPIDGCVIARVARGSEAEVNAAVAAAKAAFPAWAALGPHGRLPYLERLAHVIENRVPDLAAVETTDNGSLHEASRLRVMKRGAHNIHWFAEYATTLVGPEFATPHRQAHKLRRAERSAQVGGQASCLGAEHKPVVRVPGHVGKRPAAFGRESEPA